MIQENLLSKREEEVVKLLLQGKSNKQIASTLSISEHTVEYHLKNIYTKLQVNSRTEAVLKLGKSVGVPQGENQGDSVVDVAKKNVHNKDDAIIQKSELLGGPLPFANLLRKYSFLIVVGAGILIVIVALLRRPESWESYEREAEYPDFATVGQMISRSNASAMKVHGQFGCTAGSPWSATPGDVQYNNIHTPAIDILYLTLRYSKNSPASAVILVYLDDEPTPRATIYPVDQQNWDQFTWTEPIFLGRVAKGTHSIKFSTDGQQYGVVDLDKFVLSTSPP